MNGQQLMLYTAVMLQDNVLIDMVESNQITDNRSSLKLMIAFCDALSEVSHRFPVSLKKTLETPDGDIPLADICQSGAFTVSGVTASDKNVPFTVDSFGLHVGGGGKYTVTYVPETYSVEIGTDFEVSTDVGFVMMMHLIARNYCIFSGRVEEAAMYDSRYNDYAEARSLKRRAHIPARKFL